jgi:hypothetical protein
VLTDAASKTLRWQVRHSVVWGPAMPIARPLCPNCRTTMMLARISPDGPGFEFRSFECPECERVSIERIAIDPITVPERPRTQAKPRSMSPP